MIACSRFNKSSRFKKGYMAKQTNQKSKQMTIRIPYGIWLALRKLQDKDKIISFQDVTVKLYGQYIKVMEKQNLMDKIID
jgi:hypothetical protein